MVNDVAKLRKILSANIKQYRAKLGLTQEKLAEIVELSDQTINDIEGCRTWVSDKTLIKIARAFNIEAYQLLYPQNEAEKLNPVKVPSDILKNLILTIKDDLDKRFNEIIPDN